MPKINKRNYASQGEEGHGAMRIPLDHGEYRPALTAWRWEGKKKEKKKKKERAEISHPTTVSKQ